MSLRSTNAPNRLRSGISASPGPAPARVGIGPGTGFWNEAERHNWQAQSGGGVSRGIPRTQPVLEGGSGDIDMRRFITPGLERLALVQAGAGSGVVGTLAFSPNEKHYEPWPELFEKDIDPIGGGPRITVVSAERQRVIEAAQARERHPRFAQPGGVRGWGPARLLEDDVW